MLFSLAVIFLVGLSAAAIFQTIGLPRIIGMLATGILTGTYVLDLLDPKILWHILRASADSPYHYPYQSGAVTQFV